jgi:putative DNA methylase
MDVQRGPTVSPVEMDRLPVRADGRESPRPSVAATIERRFDVSFVAEMALREKQVQQNYRPIIAVHKWFARRPGTLFRALLLAEYGERPLREGFFLPNDLSGLHVADPFMGGGTPLLEANRVGCDVTGWDINPMAYWVVRQEMQHLDRVAYRRAADLIRSRLEEGVGSLYRTRCERCGCPDAPVKYYIWVKSQRCGRCGDEVRLFPGHLIAKDRRHTANVFVCSACGGLSEAADPRSPGACDHCRRPLAVHGPARRGRCRCSRCGEDNRYPAPEEGPPRHQMVAIEYHCQHCKPRHKGRFFKRPDGHDLARYAEAEERWCKVTPRFVPADPIPSGDETDRLHRWGYRYYREMFNPRQLLGLELIGREIAASRNRIVRGALATNLSDLLRYQNMLCRYDTMALKSLDIFSVHGFPVGLVQCESNLLGIPGKGGGNVGSGGWSNIVDKFLRAKEYCDHPFEVMYHDRRKVVVPVAGERIGEEPPVASRAPRRRVDLRCGSATEADLSPGSLDGVFTDPPYFANVQYAELMDFCYVWLRRLIGRDDSAFAPATTRHADELTGNITLARGLEHFTDGLAAVFSRMAIALKAGAPFAFTYHHNAIDAYFPVAVAMLDAGLVCTASLPCPAEMGGSIHISGTTSSIVDTVFICRTTGRISRRVLADGPAEIAALVVADLADLDQAGMRVTRGDARCVTFGHLIRLAVWQLRTGWDGSLPAVVKLARLAEAVAALGGADGVERFLPADVTHAVRRTVFARESLPPPYGEGDDEISF